MTGAVFLSYASEDASAAQRICATLRAAAIEVWLDQRELRGGDAWDAAIRTQIKSCALFVPVISSHTRARSEGYFRLEWKLAVDRSHLMATERPFIVPVVIDATTDVDARVPDKFKEIHWTRLPSGETTPEFVTRIQGLLVPDNRLGAAPISNPAAIALRDTSSTRRVSLPLVLVAVLLLGTAGLLSIMHRSASIVATPAPVALPAAAANTSAALEKSIAVLPFTDLSEKKDQQYFSDGLSEELIDLLAQIPELKVTARTSSFSFRDKQVTAAEIGRTLSVANLLEGSVRKAGNTVRITIQLVRADSGFYLWSATYDRDMKDIFKVQDDIAGMVVDKLKVALTGGTPSAPARTENTEAYNLLLRGNFAARSDTDAGTSEALDFFKRAVAIDAGYAPAWNGMAFVHFRRGSNGYQPAVNAYQIAEQEARHAIALDPHLADAYALLSTIQMLRFEWKTSTETRAKALRGDPGNWNALLNGAVQTLATGNPADAVAQMHNALARDPLNLLLRRYAARLFFYAGRLGEADDSLRQILAIDPNFSAAHYELGRVLLIRGDVAAAVVEFEKESNPTWRGFGLPLGYHSAHRDAEADVALNALLADPAGSEFQIAETYAWFGNADKTFEWLNKAVPSDPGIIWCRYDPLLASITADTRYSALLRRINLPL